MTDKACATCEKSFPGPQGELECRARPPQQDVAKFARFPVVKLDDYCWEYELDTTPPAKVAVVPAPAELPLLDASPPSPTAAVVVKPAKAKTSKAAAKDAAS